MKSITASITAKDFIELLEKLDFDNRPRPKAPRIVMSEKMKKAYEEYERNDNSHSNHPHIWDLRPVKKRVSKIVLEKEINSKNGDFESKKRIARRKDKE